MLVDDGLPAMDRARYGNGEYAFVGHLAVAGGAQLLQGRRARGPARPVQGVYLLLLVVPDEGKHVAAHAGGLGFNHVEGCGGRHGGVHGVAPVYQGLQPGLGCQGLAGGHHAVKGQHRRPSRIKEHFRLLWSSTKDAKLHEGPVRPRIRVNVHQLAFRNYLKSPLSLWERVRVRANTWDGSPLG